jgi:hypothetical protein
MGAIVMPWLGRSAPPPALEREWRPGHWLAMGNNSGRRGTYYKQTGGANTDLLRLPGMQGIQLRWRWNELEPSPGEFDFGPIKSSYADSERSIRADLWRCAQANSSLIVFLEDKSFDGSHVTPQDLRGPAHEQSWVRYNPDGSVRATGFTACRWNADIVERWGDLIRALAAEFKDHPNLHGIAFPETAMSLDGPELIAGGYDQLLYRDSIIAGLTTVSDEFPTKRVFWYMNFMPTIPQDVHLDTIANTIADHNGGNHGILMGGPDILPDDIPVKTRPVPRYLDQFGNLDLFCSFQNDSYSHNHTTSSPDPRVPGLVFDSGDIWTMDEMFVYARDYLKLQYMMWNFLAGSGPQTWEPEGRLVVVSNPTFNEDLPVHG